MNQTASRTSPTPALPMTARLLPSRMWRHPLFVCVLLAAVTMAVYVPVAHFDFINYDDGDYFLDNAHVKAGLTRESFAWAWQTTQNSSWYPLTWLSLMLDAQLFGLGPAGPHFTNLLLHTINVVLLFGLLLRLTGSIWRSAFVAALFSLHPLRVETVAWISERKGVLSAFFGFLSLIFYTRYVGQASPLSPTSKLQRASPRQAGSLSYAIALFFFALGLMSKPVLVTWPFLLLLLDFWPLKRFNGSTIQRFNLSLITRHSSLLFEKTPFFLVAVFSSVVTFWVHKETGSLAPPGEYSVSDRVGNALVSYARYLGRTFWPVDLAVPYPHPGSWPAMDVVAAAVLVVGLCVVAIWQARRRPYCFTGWFWFWGTLVPVIGVIQWSEQAMADRFTYVPAVGVFVLLVWGVGEVCLKWRLLRVVVAAGAALILGALSLRTANQLRYWRNSETLFRHALAVTRDNDVAHVTLGSFLITKGFLDEAIEHYRCALQIDPTSFHALNNLGVALRKKGDLDATITCFREALRRRPDDPGVLSNLGYTLTMKKGQLEEGIAILRRAIQRGPDNAEAHCFLGEALALNGQQTAALEQFREAVRLAPADADIHYNLAVLLSQAGQTDEAIQSYLLALKFNPDRAEALNNMGIAFTLKDRFDEAVGQFSEALRLRPDYAEAHNNLACALIKLGRREEAIQHLREALRLKPDYEQARQQLRELGVPEQK